MSKRVQVFFVLNTANASEENEKLARTCATLTYTAIKDTLKKVLSDNSSKEYKAVPGIKEEVETVNFNQY